MGTLLLAVLSGLALSTASIAAGFPIRDGEMKISVSGSNYGEDAGNLEVRLSYADAAKSAVKIEGRGRFRAKEFTINETHPLSALKRLRLAANGAYGYDGSNGMDGRDGYNGMSGSNGFNGWDGCPPSSGHNGSDGSSGGDGTDGTDGGDGGDGGNGGAVKVTVAAEESELLLLVKAEASAGYGGDGGKGGRGGRGGQGGQGGMGGNGGQNTCTNEKGEFVGGAPGFSGSNGMNGSNGRDGRHGSNGYAGRDGRKGSSILTLVDASGAGKDYPAVFQLEIGTVTAVDDNEDTVVVPGELVHITSITVANNGPMPTPASQALSLAFGGTSTLLVRNAAAVAVGEMIPANSSRTLNFAKGTVVFQAPAKADLVGKEAKFTAQIQINSFVIGSTEGSGLEIKWPVGISGGDDEKVYFGSEGKVNFSLKNVTTRDVGPSTEPVEVEFSWKAKEIPGADVLVALPDGRQFTLDRPYAVNDLTVPAKGKLSLPLVIKLTNSKKLLRANGNLKATLRLKSFSPDGKEAIDSAGVQVYAVKDFRNVSFSKKRDIRRSRIVCRFPNRVLQTLDITQLVLSKKSGTETVRFQIAREGFLSNGTSPQMSTSVLSFAPYMELVSGGSTSQAVSFLNKIVAPATAGLESTWRMQPGSCKVKQ